MYHEIVLAGVALSLLFAEITGLSPAGIIVPGYVALCLQTPRRVFYTLFVALAAWGLTRLVGRVAILYGRRLFAVTILLAYVVDLLVRMSNILPYDPGLIGVLVPGIMAQSFERQGFFRSVLSLAVVVGILALIMMVRGMQVLPI